MIEKLQLRNYSPKTIKAYVAAVEHFAKHVVRPSEVARQMVKGADHFGDGLIRDVRIVSFNVLFPHS